MVTDPARRIEEIIDENNTRLQQYRQLAADLSEIEGTAASPDNLIRVTVTHTGMLKDVQVSPQIGQNPPRDLGTTIVGLAQRAHAEASRRMARTVEPVLGADSRTMQIIQGFVPAEEDASAGTGRTGNHRPGRTDEDDDYFGGSVFR